MAPFWYARWLREANFDSLKLQRRNGFGSGIHWKTNDETPRSQREKQLLPLLFMIREAEPPAAAPVGLAQSELDNGSWCGTPADHDASLNGTSHVPQGGRNSRKYLLDTSASFRDVRLPQLAT